MRLNHQMWGVKLQFRILAKVLIYFDGRATGVTFHIQEKSVTNLLKRKSGHFLVYPLKVSDLKHWEAFSFPVVVIIWDIKQKEGRWGLVKDLISQLDQNRPRWRTQSKVNVQIPWANTTEDAGLNQLKASIGRHVYNTFANFWQSTSRPYIWR